MQDKKINKCYSCRRKIKKGQLLCKSCEEDPDSVKNGSRTYIIYNKIR